MTFLSTIIPYVLTVIPVAIIIPMVVAVLVVLFTKHRKIIEYTSVIGAFCSLIAASTAAYLVTTQGAYTEGPYLSIDALGAIILLVVSLTSFIVTIYAISYFRNETDKLIVDLPQVKRYFLLQNLFILAMFIAIMSTNPIMMWIMIEATTLATAFLVSYYNKPSAVEGAWKYLIINSIGLLFGFLGTLLFIAPFVAQNPGTFVDWSALRSLGLDVDPELIKMAFIFILIGYGTKIGFVPLHTWKPDAYSKAPAPIGALFSSALLPVALLALLKFKAITDGIVGVAFASTLLLAFGLLSMVVASVIIFTSRNYKRLFAYSSIENAGIVAIGFAFGGVGAFAALLHLIYHSLVKSTLFLVSGNLLLRYGSAKIENIRGAFASLPITSTLLVIGVLAVGGVAPFGAFITKMLIFSSGLELHPIVVITALLATIVAFMGLLKHLIAMIYSDTVVPSEPNRERLSWLNVPSIVLTGILICLSVATPSFLITLLETAIASV